MKNFPLRFLILITPMLWLSNPLKSNSDCGVSSYSHIYYSLDSCHAYVFAGTTMDYSEFTAYVNEDQNCAELTPIGTVHRENPAVNKHSCTPGVDGDLAMCISSLDFCQFIPDHEQALRFEFMVDPKGITKNYLSSLKFYEQGPEEYNWIDGATGPNNYPLYYGIRILKNGLEVFSQDGISTSRDWSLQEFDFSGMNAFVVDELSVFSFELLPYCLVGNSAAVNAWDIDEIEIKVACAAHEPEAGLIGFQSGNSEIEFCRDDAVFNFADLVVTGTSGTHSVWVITTSDSTIVDLVNADSVDFGAYAHSELRLWYLKYEGNPAGLELGQSLADLDGCYSISNCLIIRLINIHASVIELQGGGTEYIHCLNYGSDFNVLVNASSQHGLNSKWIIVDAFGYVVDVQDSHSINITNAQYGLCYIYNVCYYGNSDLIAIGNHISVYQECYSLSNAITIYKDYVSGGNISINGQTELEYCVYDNVDLIVNADLVNAFGSGSLWILTNEHDIIQNIFTNSSINLGSIQSINCRIYHLSYTGVLSGISIGGSIHSINACYALSNYISIRKIITSQPHISYNGTNYIQLCNQENIWSGMYLDIVGHVANSLAWLICDANGNILDINFSLPLNLNAYAPGTCYIYALSYNSSHHGLSVGGNIAAIAGSCVSLSNAVVIDKIEVDAGSINVNGKIIVNECLGNQSKFIHVSHSSNYGGSSAKYLLTDQSGNIISIQDHSFVEIKPSGPQLCHIYYIRYAGSVSGLAIGSNINLLQGCYDVSNAVVVTKQYVSGGTIHSEYGGTHLNICLSTGASLEVNAIVNGAYGDYSAWVLIDSDDRIISIQSNAYFNFANYPVASYSIRHVSYNSHISGLSTGAFFSNISGYCLDYSNAIYVNVYDVDGGLISSDQGEVIEICEDGTAPSILNVHLEQNKGLSSVWLLTNANGTIMRILSAPPFSIGSIPSGESQIVHMSFSGNIIGLLPGQNISGIHGCVDFSNIITIIKGSHEGGNLHSSFGNTIDLCLSQGQSEFVDVVASGATGLYNTLVITDQNGIVLSVPGSSPIEINSSYLGRCFVWNLSSETQLTQVSSGSSIYDIDACYGISDSLVIDKRIVSGALIDSDKGDLIVLCDSPGSLLNVQFFIAGGTGLFNNWLLIDADNRILDIRSNPDFDLASISGSESYVVHISYDSDLTGLYVGGDLDLLSGCYGLSNVITIQKIDVFGGLLESSISSDIVFCTNDGIPDIVEFNLVANQGTSSQLIISNSNGDILDLPSTNIYDFEGIPEGECYASYVSYSNVISNLSIGSNLALVEGCFAFSNTLKITKIQAQGGHIDSEFGSSIFICVDDEGDVVEFDLSFNVGTGSAWLLTDENGFILDIYSSSSIDLDRGVEGVFHICHVSYSGSLVNLSIGSNLTELEGCYDVSNTIIVNAISVTSGVLSSNRGDDVLICAQDTESDLIEFNVTGSLGNLQLVITDDAGQILELVIGSSFDFNNASEGVCYVYNVAYAGSITGLVVGGNVNLLDGCLDVSNAIRIERIATVAGEISTSLGDSLVICVDGNDDLVEFTMSGNNSEENIWVLVSVSGVIMDITSSQIINLDRGVSEVYYVYNLAYSSTIQNLVTGNLLADIEGCYSVSNRIVVNATLITYPVLESSNGDSFEICVDDGLEDPVDFSITSNSSHNYLIITDQNGIISSVSSSYTGINLDDNSAGLCYVWSISFEGNLDGLTPGSDVASLDGCYKLSNSIEVIKTIKDAGYISVAGFDSLTLCYGDGIDDFIYVENTINVGSGLSAWLITDSSDYILDIQYALPLDINGSSLSKCKIYFICYTSSTSGMLVGANLTDIEGCNAISNAVHVTKSVYEEIEEHSSMLLFDMELCYADTEEGSNMDYTEFTASTMSSDHCVEYRLLYDNLYRENPNENKHSCTEGADGTAMCVGTLNFCDFIKDSELAVRFSVELSPGPNGMGSLGSLSFYEQSPDTYSWIDGPSGPNNYPLLYGVRILKDGEEVYFEKHIPTNSQWTLQEFDFTDNVDFHFTETSVFEFELLAYCLAGISSSVSAWDLDEIKLNTNCKTGLVPGVIKTTDGSDSAVLCVENDLSEDLDVVILEGNGQNSVWLLLNEDYTILDIQDSAPVDFDAVEDERIHLMLLSYSDGVNGLRISNNLDDLEGCFVISNTILVSKDDSCMESVVIDKGQEDFNIRRPLEAFSYYPNPAIDNILVQTDHLPAYGTRLSIYDRMGRKMQVFNLETATRLIDISGLSNGLYYLKIESGENVITGKFIKL